MKRQKKSILRKLLVLLSLTRWYNVLLTLIAQYLAAFFVFNNWEGKHITLFDPNLHIIVACTAIFLSAGYIINFFYDKEVDLINYPKRTQLFLTLNKEYLLRIYFTLVVAGLSLAFWASINIGLWFFAIGFMLWFYSHKLKRMPYLREISATLLTITSFFSITLHYGWINTEMFLYGWFMFFIILIREGFKDQEKVKGNAVYSYYSLSLLHNHNRFLQLLVFLAVLALIPIFIFVGMHGLTHYSSISMITVWVMLLAAVLLMMENVNVRYAGLGNNLLKIAMIISIFGIVWL